MPPSSSTTTARTQATAQSLGATCLLAFATVLFGMITSGRFTNYLQPWFKPYLLAAVIVMVALGIWTLLTASDTLTETKLETVASSEDSPASEPHTNPQHHTHDTPRVAGFLLLPALVFALAAPAALGTDAAAQQPALDSAQVAKHDPIDFDPLPAQGITELTVQDYSDRFVWGRPEDLVDKRVRMLGFVAHPDDLGDGMWSVNRFRIYCCAADANLYSVAVSGAAMPEGENVWVEVEGFLDQQASTTIPVLNAVDVQIVDEPAEPYL